MKAVYFKYKMRLKILVVKFIKKSLLKFAPSVLSGSGRAASSTGSLKFLLMLHAIEVSKEPVATINYMLNSLELSDRDIWLGLIDLRGRASPNFDLANDHCDQIDSADIRLRLIYSKVISSDKVLSSDDVDALVFHYLKDAENLKSKQSIRSMLASLILLRAPLSVVSRKLEDLSFCLSSLTESQKIQFMHRLKAGRQRKDFANWVSLLDIRSAPARIKLMQIKGELFGGGLELFNEIEKEFIDLEYDVSKLFETELKPIFDSIPKDKNLIWIQYDDSAIRGFKRSIIDTVRGKKPLSYIRIGDGECYAFSDDIFVNAEGVQRQERHWWGASLSTSLRKRLHEKFMEALVQVDILGVPTVTRLVKDFNLEKKDRYFVNSAISRNLCVMKAVERFIPGKIITDCQSNLFLFDKDFCNELFAEASKVIVVSGVKKELVRNWAPNLEKLECIEIPTHRLLRDEEVGAETAGILPDVYEDYVAEISKCAAPGMVFLISAGFIGKIFVAEAARHGAVALDMGQTLVAAVNEVGAGE